MQTWELVLTNLVILIASAVGIVMLCGKSGDYPPTREESWLKRFFLSGIVLFNGARMLPFLLALLV